MSLLTIGTLYPVGLEVPVNSHAARIARRGGASCDACGSGDKVFAVDFATVVCGGCLGEVTLAQVMTWEKWHSMTQTMGLPPNINQGFLHHLWLDGLTPDEAYKELTRYD